MPLIKRICLQGTIVICILGIVLLYESVQLPNNVSLMPNLFLKRTRMGVNKTIVERNTRRDQGSQVVECRESEYEFDGNNSNTIFSDQELWTKCGINSTFNSTNYETLKHHRIRKKCGTITATLILKHFKRIRRKRHFLVPNVVHYIIFGRKNFTFLNYLSFRSSSNFLKPNSIFIHGDYNIKRDHAYWWRKMLDDVPNVYFVWSPKVKYIQRRRVKYAAHMADMLRLQILIDNGGIYLDTDVIVLGSFDKLRKKYPLTLGRETAFSVASGIILSAPRQPFLCVWYNGYRDYDPTRPDAWGYFSVITAHKLSKLFPQHVHIEEVSLMRPSWINKEVGLLFHERYDWSNNYAIHVWKRLGPVPAEPKEIDHLNTTLGEVMRYVYYNG